MPVTTARYASELLRTHDWFAWDRQRLNGSAWLAASYSKSRRLEKHSGCINSVTWNQSGTKLVTGSDDRSVVLWSGEDFQPIITVPTGHRNNVFCVSFVEGSNDSELISSAADGCVHLLNIETGQREVLSGSELSWYCFKHCADPMNPRNTGLVTISDGSVIRFDLRSKEATEVLNVRQDIDLRHLSMGRFSTPPSGTDIAFNPIDPYVFALGTSTRAVLLYDTRNLSSCGSKIIPEFTVRSADSFPGETEAVSGLDWDTRNGLIVNYCRQSVIEVNTSMVAWKGSGQPVRYRVGNSEEIPRQWTGRVNHQTFLKEVALVGNGNFVATGGDCGSLFIWSRFDNQKLILKKPADPYVLNCIAPHPYLPVLATAGIASTADIWEVKPNASTTVAESEEASDLEEEVDSIVREEVSSDEGRSRIDEATILRTRANICFRESDFLNALNLYNEACSVLQFRCNNDGITNNRRRELEKNFTNKAAALMSLSRWTEAIDACDDALDLNPNSTRALIRRSKCYLRLGDLTLALEDVEHVLLTDPTESDALSILDDIHLRLTESQRL